MISFVRKCGTDSNIYLLRGFNKALSCSESNITSGSFCTTSLHVFCCTNATSPPQRDVLSYSHWFDASRVAWMVWMTWNVRNAFVPGCVMRLKGDLWIVDVTVDSEIEDSILVLKGFIFILVFVSCSVCAIFGFDCATGKKDGLTKLRLLSLIFLGPSGCC